MEAMKDTPYFYPCELHYFVMALEDRAFVNHHGIHMKSIIREVYKLILRKKHGGASTIDMQMVRTITGFKEKTFSRKLYEATLAVLINFKYSKLQIINCYLHHAFFGSHLYGLNSAIEYLFNKKYLTNLNDEEMAIIAAMLQKPKPLNPSAKWRESVMKRARYAQTVRIRIKNSLN